MKTLILPLPKGASYVDQFFAKRIQRIISTVGGESSLMILFITHESHRQLVKNFYKVGKTKVMPLNSVVNMTASLSEGTLLYSWGSAAFGKLGIGLSTEDDCEGMSEFVREDLAR